MQQVSRFRWSSLFARCSLVFHTIRTKCFVGINMLAIISSDYICFRWFSAFVWDMLAYICLYSILYGVCGVWTLIRISTICVSLSLACSLALWYGCDWTIYAVGDTIIYDFIHLFIPVSLFFSSIVYSCSINIIYKYIHHTFLLCLPDSDVNYFLVCLHDDNIILWKSLYLYDQTKNASFFFTHYWILIWIIT